MAFRRGKEDPGLSPVEECSWEQEKGEIVNRKGSQSSTMICFSRGFSDYHLTSQDPKSPSLHYLSWIRP